MAINSWYQGNQDNVTDDGGGWQDLSGHAYGNHIAGGIFAYSFGPVINNYGTWGQLIYRNPADLLAADGRNPTGLNGHMPQNPGPYNSNWVQGHLVNGECGGGSNRACFLTPITHGVNMWHAGYEAVLQRLVNRGAAQGAGPQFNPNNIPNSYLIYRTHALPPPVDNNFQNVPSGLCVSLGIVIDGIMRPEAAVQNEFNGQGMLPWFANRYYIAHGAHDRQRILEMIGGTQIAYH